MAKVLLVEDDPFLSTLLKNRLEKEGFEVVLAKDGTSAIQALTKDKFRPDVILLDIILPEKNGFEVLEEAREISDIKKIRTLILSNLGQDVDVKRGEKLGAEYLIKARTSLDEIVKRLKAIAAKSE